MTFSLSQTALLSILLLLSLHQACAKKEHLHFYFHETLAGPNATVLTVVKAPNGLPLGFGTVAVIDDILRDGPNDNSTLIGRAQGLVGVAGMDGGALATMLNFVFTGGQYNGSSLAIYGRVVASAPIERSVIGGTGVFRMARGYQIGNYVPSSSSATKVVYEFDTYIRY